MRLWACRGSASGAGDDGASHGPLACYGHVCRGHHQPRYYSEARVSTDNLRTVTTAVALVL